MVGHPRMTPAKMSLDPEQLPVFQLLIDISAHGLRLESERVPAEIHAVVAIRSLWNMKTLAKGCQRIAGIHLRSERYGGIKSGASQLDLPQRREFAMNQVVRLLPIKVFNSLDRVAQRRQNSILNFPARSCNGVRHAVESNHRVLRNEVPRILRLQCELRFLLKEEARIGNPVAHLDE